MATKNSSHGHAEEPPSDPPRKDAWGAFGYLVSGVAVYGLVGWGLDQWWDTSFMVAIGIVVGAGLGIYMTQKAFGTPPPSDESSDKN